MKKQQWYYTTGNEMKAPSSSPFFDGGNTTRQEDSGSETTSTSQGTQNILNPVLPTPLGLPQTPKLDVSKVQAVGNDSTQPVAEPTDNTTLYLIVGALAVLYFLKGN